MKLFLLVLALNLSIRFANAELLPPITIASKPLGENRTIRVYLPPGYSTNAHQRYPVLYLHDGQNVFSSAGSNACFGWGPWDLDVTADKLIAQREMAPVIMVGIDCGVERMFEMSGEIATGSKPPTLFDNYSAFVMGEVKPLIDARFRTKTNAENTAIMGSSMGGIASVALAWRHPDVFGKCASLSGAYQVFDAHFLESIAAYRGSKKAIKIYLDSGVTDYSGYDDNRELTADLARELTRIGWSKKNLEVFVDFKPKDDAPFERNGLPKSKWAEARNSQHNEFYWRLRAWRPLEFLFPP